MYEDLSIQVYVLRDWPVKKAIVNLPISMKGNLKHTSSNSSSPLGAQKMYLSTALPMLLSKLKLCL